MQGKNPPPLFIDYVMVVKVYLHLKQRKYTTSVLWIFHHSRRALNTHKWYLILIFIVANLVKSQSLNPSRFRNQWLSQRRVGKHEETYDGLIEECWIYYHLSLLYFYFSTQIVSPRPHMASRSPQKLLKVITSQKKENIKYIIGDNIR